MHLKIYFEFRFSHDKNLNWVSMNNLALYFHLFNFCFTFLEFAIPKYFCAFVEDVTSRQLKNTHDSLFNSFNNYHEKIKFTVETNLQKFLDTQYLLENDIIKTKVYRKANKFPAHWKFPCTLEIVLIDVRFCNESEKVSKQLLRKLRAFAKKIWF